MKMLISHTLIFTLLICCNQFKTETIIIDKDSEELVYLIELSTKNNSLTDVEDFTQSITEFIKNTESPAVYGYFISENNEKVTLIERWRNSQDAMQHGLDFINGKNFDRFFEIFELSSFISLGNPTNELKKFNSDNGFVVDYRETIGGFVLKQ